MPSSKPRLKRLTPAATAQNKADAALGSAKSYADTKKSEAVNSAAATAQSKADAALNSAKSYADTKKNEAITQAGKDADSKICIDHYAERLHCRCQESRYRCPCRGGCYHLESQYGRLVEQADLHRCKRHIHGETIRQHRQRHQHQRLADYGRHHRYRPSECCGNPVEHHQCGLHQRSDVCFRSGHHRRLDHRCNHVIQQPHPVGQRQQTGGRVRGKL